MASEIQGLPEADRETEDGAGVGLEGGSSVGEIYRKDLGGVVVTPGSYCLLSMLEQRLVSRW